MSEKILYNLKEIDEVSKQIINLLFDTRLILLRGDLGTGKTTLIKSILNEMGLKENITSPTFSIVNEYELNRESIYHFDLYRIKDKKELDILGFDEYLDSGQKCFIEWPEIAIERIFCSYVDIYIESKSVEEREITIKTID